MPSFKDAKPQISLRLYKTIDRKTIDGKKAVSSRYEGREAFIDLTHFLGDGSSVTTTKGIREPAGAFSITFSDQPQVSSGLSGDVVTKALESIYGLVEPMDMIEIRMWKGVGVWPKGKPYPIKMRGFVSKVGRGMAMGPNGIPARTVSISGQDYGKIWQMYQVLYLRAYDASAAYLTAYNMFEKFGIQATNVLKSSEYIKLLIDKIINPFMDEFVPKNSPMPRSIKTDQFILVKHGVINGGYQSAQGSLYELAKMYGDVGVWNELYIEDKSDGVHVVYRPIPAMHISKPDGAKSYMIQDDAPEPIYNDILDDDLVSISSERSDDNVANFFWVNNQKYDLIDDIYRKLFAVQAGQVSTGGYANSATKYYGVRPMYSETNQGADLTYSESGGLPADKQESRSIDTESWIDNRRRLMIEMNKDNVVFEQGSARIKGGLMRADNEEHIKAGDYAKFKIGAMEYTAYITQIVDEFVPFQSYIATITYERGQGFVTRSAMESGKQSPWLAEQATRKGS
jgi:hypothetical protein